MFTETVTGPETAVSMGRIVAVNCVALKVVARGDPFQFTTESLVKVVPLVAFTVSGKPLVLLQNGMEDGEMDPIDGFAAGWAVTVKKTRFETSVVVVAEMLDVPEVAEPGMSTATAIVPGVARYEAGTGAVNVVPFTNVVVSEIGLEEFAFHRRTAPETNPEPVAVSVKPVAPAVKELGARVDSVEDDVWTVRFVLNWEQADASPHTTNATMSHFREHIRTRSSRATRGQSGQIKMLCTQSGF